MKYEFEQIISDLKNKIYKPIYFLSGEEAYFIDLITKYIQDNVLTEAEKSFNQTVLYGKGYRDSYSNQYCQKVPDDGKSSGDNC